MGVRRAVELALDAPGKLEEPIYTYGPLIHNPQVLSLLAEKGISVLQRIPVKGSGTVIVRAHGVPPQAKQALADAGFHVIDATCPRVIKVQTIIGRHARKGYASIIIGDRDHPEVAGLLGYAGDNGYTAASLADLEALPVLDQAIVVAQTTQNTAFFGEVKAWVARQRPHYRIFDTICDSTEKRQAEVKRLSESVDAFVVVGGRASGNTRRLAEIARQSGKPVCHVETESELADRCLETAQSVGITAGASTPNWIIKRVYRTIEALPYQKCRGWHRLMFSVQRGLLLTNLYVAMGAGGLCYACTRLLGIGAAWPYVLIAMLYVQSMHTLNHLTGKKADRYNDPDRARFYADHKLFLHLFALLSGGGGLVTAFIVGKLAFSILMGMSLLGLSYNLKLFPSPLGTLKIQRIRDIPGSKTLLITTAWGVVTVLFPSLAHWNTCGWPAVLVLLWSSGMVFARTTFFDILDMQGDRIVGKETIAILFGEKRALRFLKLLLAAIFLALLLPIDASVFLPVSDGC